MAGQRLWDKGPGQGPDRLVHRFTVGGDPQLDRRLVRWDAIGSAAHARMLESIGVLSAAECSALLEVLRAILEESDRDGFEIPWELEDCHTAIETRLTDELGDTGRKIHTGRSRNDQVLVAMRLYLRHQAVDLLQWLASTTEALLERIPEVRGLPLPGYTHLQPAMPSSLVMWLHAFAEGFLSLVREGLGLLDSLDSCPLGAAAGFGVPLELDRELTALLLGFGRVQRSPLEVQNSRGRHEIKVLRWGEDIASVVEKLAGDLLLYGMRELGFVSLPGELTTGSSIMPQKHNPDVLELLRAGAARVRAAASEVGWVVAKLPSSYHRDFQATKEPTLRGIEHLLDMFPVLQRVIGGFRVNEEALQEAMSDELYATYDAYRRIRDGRPFREAYREAAERATRGELDRWELEADFEIIARAIDREVIAAHNDLDELRRQLDRWIERLAGVEEGIFQAEPA